MDSLPYSSGQTPSKVRNAIRATLYAPLGQLPLHPHWQFPPVVGSVFRVMMRSLVLLVLLGAWHILAEPSLSPAFLSLSSPTPSSPLSSPPLSLSSYSASVPPSSLTSSYSSGNVVSSQPLPSPFSSSTSGSYVLTQPLPSAIPIISYPFMPLPSPPSEPPIVGLYPLASPNTPPPVESPALVPDFAPAWASAYEKAKAKVS